MQKQLYLKKCIRYSQALRIKRICSTFKEYVKILRALTKKFVDKGHNKNPSTPKLKEQTIWKDWVIKQTTISRKSCIPLSGTYNPMLPKLKEIIDNHWNILNINQDYRDTFKTALVIALRKNVSLKQIFGTNKIKNNKYKIPYASKLLL